jgi:pimeloyl-ACP methyl ester carboxylesterase
MNTAIILLILLLITGYLLAALYLYINQRSMIYFPHKGPSDSHDTTFEIESDGHILKGWMVNPGQQKAIIYFGGNSERIEGNIDAFQSIFPHYTLYLLNYRGFGESDGKPTEAGLYQDALAIYDHIKAGHAHISVIGRSLGSGVATWLAASRRVEKLILVTPFDSAQEVAQKAFPFFPMSLLLKDKHDSWGRAKQIDSRILMIIASDDAIISREHSDRLAEQFKPEQIKVVVIDDATHNTIATHPEFFDAMKNFMA